MPLILELSELGSIYNRENELFPKLNFFTSEKTLYCVSIFWIHPVEREIQKGENMLCPAE